MLVMVVMMSVHFGSVIPVVGVVVLRFVSVMVMLVLVRRRVFVLMPMLGPISVLMLVFVFMPTPMPIPMLVFVPMLVAVGVRLLPVVVMMLVAVTVTALMLILIRRVRCAFVNAEFHTLDALPMLPLKVHVKVAEIDLRELPLEAGRLHAEVDERADGHVAGDAGEAIEEEDFHGKRSGRKRLVGGGKGREFA
jgi:hypothetical protein